MKSENQNTIPKSRLPYAGIFIAVCALVGAFLGFRLGSQTNLISALFIMVVLGAVGTGIGAYALSDIAVESDT